MYTFPNKQFVISWQSIKLTTKTCLSLVNRCIFILQKNCNSSTTSEHVLKCTSWIQRDRDSIKFNYRSKPFEFIILSRKLLIATFNSNNFQKEKSFFSYMVTMEYMKIHNYTYNIFNTHKSLSIMSILKTQGMHTYLEISY